MMKQKKKKGQTREVSPCTVRDFCLYLGNSTIVAAFEQVEVRYDLPVPIHSSRDRLFLSAGAGACQCTQCRRTSGSLVAHFLTVPHAHIT